MQLQQNVTQDHQQGVTPFVKCSTQPACDGASAHAAHMSHAVCSLTAFCLQGKILHFACMSRRAGHALHQFQIHAEARPVTILSACGCSQSVVGNARACGQADCPASTSLN